MARQLIGIGTVDNDGTGDTPKSVGQKINAMTGELYSLRTRSRPFGIYYGVDPNADLEEFQTLVLEAAAPDALITKFKPGRLLLGYMALCEVQGLRSYYAYVNSQSGWVINSPIPSWPDSKFLDVRSTDLRAYYVNSVIPLLLARGFSGVFLDTVDDADVLEGSFPGYTAATASFIAEIKAAFPNTPLMVNRGYSVAEHVNCRGKYEMLLGESLHSKWVGEPATYQLQTDSDVLYGITHLDNARALNPLLEVYSLNYWDPADLVGIANLYRISEAAGLRSYVATKALNVVLARGGSADGAAQARVETLRRQVLPRVNPIQDYTSIIIDGSKGDLQTVTLYGSPRAFPLPINMAPGQTLRVWIRQDFSGGRVANWDAAWLFPNGAEPTLSTASGALDILTVSYDGVNCAGSLEKSFG